MSSLQPDGREFLFASPELGQDSTTPNGVEPTVTAPNVPTAPQPTEFDLAMGRFIASAEPLEKYPVPKENSISVERIGQAVFTGFFKTVTFPAYVYLRAKERLGER